MKNLIAKIVLFFFLLFVPFSVSAGGIPVFDGVNLSQNMLAALENIMQTLKQIEEYKTQLDQYQRQLEDARNFDLSDFLWDQADQTIAAMLDQVGTVNQIKDLVNDVNFYKNAIDDGLTISEINAIYDKVKSKLKIENTSIGELIDTVDDQQKRIAKDANILVQLQKKVQSAGDVGQLQAIQSANMLASHMSNQLLQIRALMAAQSNIEAAYKLKLNEQEAKMNAVRKSIREGKYIPSTPVSF